MNQSRFGSAGIIAKAADSPEKSKSSHSLRTLLMRNGLHHSLPPHCCDSKLFLPAEYYMADVIYIVSKLPLVFSISRGMKLGSAR